MNKLILIVFLNLILNKSIAESIIIEDFFNKEQNFIIEESKYLNIKEKDLIEYMNSYVKYKTTSNISNIKYELEKISNICYKFNKTNKINLKNCYNGNINDNILNAINKQIELNSILK